MQKKVILFIMLIVAVLVGISGCVEGGISEYDYDDHTDTPSDSSSSSGSTYSSNCPECGGTGEVTCYNTATGGTSCAGTGIVQGGGTDGLKCRICGGSGGITCPTCGGSGRG